jgi:hypothetical protein
MFRVVTNVCNNPIFIELQYLLLKKFLKTEFEFIVFNDAKDWPDKTNSDDPTMRQQIIDICEKWSIQCINVENKYQQSRNIRKYGMSQRHADCLLRIYDMMKKEKGEYLLMDSDMFLVSELDIEKYRKWEIAFVIQDRKMRIPTSKLTYIWPGLVYYNTNKLENQQILFQRCAAYTYEDCKCDTGGASYKWLRKYHDFYPTMQEVRTSEKQLCTDKFYFIKYLNSGSWIDREFPENLNPCILDFVKSDPRQMVQSKHIYGSAGGWMLPGGGTGKAGYRTEIFDNTFLHIGAMCNWADRGKSQEAYNKVVSSWTSCVKKLVSS